LRFDAPLLWAAMNYKLGSCLSSSSMFG
jgi:hypothetical protein